MGKTDCTDPISPPRQITELLIHQARNLQMLPDIAIKAIAIAEAPDARIKDLVNVVAQDIHLTASIVALSNSSLFGCTQSTASLQKAITRVGFRQAKNMIMASSITSMMRHLAWHEFHIRDLLMKHSFLTAVINSRLNALFRLGLQGEEFTAGLVHDVGRTLLAVALGDEFDAIDPLSFDESQEQLDLESKAIGMTHEEVGAWFLQRNHLPDELITVARYHHSPGLSPKFKRLVAMTAIADDMANFYQREGSESGYNCEECPNLHLLEKLGVEDPLAKLMDHSADILASSNEEIAILNCVI